MMPGGPEAPQEALSPQAYRPESFQPHRLLPGGHLQTIATDQLPRWQGPWEAGWRQAGQEVLIDLPDGDRLLGLLHVQAADPDLGRPVALHLHGLEGSVDSPYMRGLSRKAFAAGYHSLRLNFRNCGDTEHLAAGMYHGRRTGDLAAVLDWLRARGFQEIFVTGVSLGGNLLLRHLADLADQPPPGVIGACAISSAIELARADEALKQGFNRIYNLHFVLQMKRKVARKVRLSPDGDKLRHLLRPLARTWSLRAFDDLVTAPVNGYPDAPAYYRHASAAEDLGAIRVPTLLIHAQDDPFVPFDSYARRLDRITANPLLVACFPRHGGHVGFWSRQGRHRRPWMDAHWVENEAIAYLEHLRPLA